MDHEESFYYYIMAQKAETWNRSVGWYNFDKNHVNFRKLVMNSGCEAGSGESWKKRWRQI